MKFFAILPFAGLALASPVVKRQYAGEDTQNQLKDGTPCRDYTIIFARGTTEDGNVGSLTGPPFFQAVAERVGSNNLAVQGVEYPADVDGFLAGGSAQGSQNLADLARQAMAQCPDTKLTLSGYSQGAQLVHNAAEMLSADTTAFVSSAVTFGDPEMDQPIGNIPDTRTLIICHIGDNICEGGNLILPPHLNYAMDAGRAANFVVAAAQL